MKKRMLNYGKGLAQGHTRKDQAGVKQGFLTPHQQLALYPWLFLFASDTCSKKQKAKEFGLLGSPPVSYEEVTLLEDPTE